MSNNHIETREGDEIVCSCGLRWGVDESDPHPVVAVTAPKSLSGIAQRMRSEWKLNSRRTKR